MGGRLALGVRLAVGTAVALTLLLGFAAGSGARTTDTSSVSISGPATVAEGSPATFTVSVSPAAGAEFTVPYTVDDGGSPAPGGTLTFSGTDTSQQFNVTPADDGVANPDRTLTVTLGTPQWTDSTADQSTAPTVSGGPAQTTVVDSDWQIGAIATTPNPATVSEKGGGTIDFQLSLNGQAVANHPVTVDYAVNDGSAQLGRDYTISKPSGQASGTLTFATGTSTVDVQITAKDDGLYGTDRNLSVTFSNAKGASIAGGSETAQATISEADPPPHMGISNCAGGGTVTAGGVATFPILLAGSHPATTLPSSVDYTTVDDSTVSGDYTAVSGTATIPVGSREFDVTVQTNASAPAGDRSFHIQLSNPQNVVLDNTAGSCTIHSTASGGGGSSTQPSIQITGPGVVTAPASGTTTANVKLSLTLPTPQPSSPSPVTVNWQTQDGTAKAGTDYTASSGSLTWPAGSSADPAGDPIPITILAGSGATDPITFSVVFTSTDATFTDSGTVTITIAPPGSTVPMLSIANASAASHAGTVPVTVTLAPAGTQPVTVDYATADGTDASAAKAGTNYTATSGTLTFAPGETSKTISVPVLPNSVVSPNRDFTVTLGNPTGGAEIAVGTATVTILNDVSPTVVPPVLKPKSTPLTHSVPLPAQQPTQSGSHTHLVLVQMLSGTSKVDAKGRAIFTVGCPSIAIRTCTGTAVFEVGVRQQVGKGKNRKTVIKTVRVASGTYSVRFGKTGTFTAKVTPVGMKLLKTYKRMQVKATLTSKDASGATGVTAWLVSLQAPKVAATKVSKAKATKAARMTIVSAHVVATKTARLLAVRVNSKTLKSAKLKITVGYVSRKNQTFVRTVKTNKVVRVAHLTLPDDVTTVRVAFA